MQTMKRNGKIDLLRFLFSVIIVLHHSRYLVGDANSIFLGGSFAVEFFFIVSGFLMMAAIHKRSLQPQPEQSLGKETLGFLWHKFKSLYPEALIAWFIALAVHAICRNKTFVDAYLLMMDTFFEVTFLKMSGIANTPLNGVTWYISSMLLSMAILYPLIRKYPDIMKHIALPLIALLCLGYLRGEFGSPRKPTQWIGFTFKGNLRALAEISLGAIGYNIVQKYTSLRFTTLGKILLTLTEWSLYIAIFVYMFCADNSRRECFFILLLFIAICISFSSKGIDSAWFNNRVVYWLGRYSLPLYLSHTYWSQNLNYILPADFTDLQRMGVYLLCAVVTSLSLWGVCTLIRKALPKLRSGIQRLLLVP